MSTKRNKEDDSRQEKQPPRKAWLIMEEVENLNYKGSDTGVSSGKLESLTESPDPDMNTKTAEKQDVILSLRYGKNGNGKPEESKLDKFMRRILGVPDTYKPSARVKK